MSRSIEVQIPETVEPYAEDIRRFVDAMVYKLALKANKGRWEDLPIAKAYELMIGETEELRDAIGDGNLIEILLEAADTANFALIIASIAIERGK